MKKAVPGLELVRAESDADLAAMIAVRRAANPDGRPPQLENLRHWLASSDVLVYLVARVDGEPVGCGFVDPWPDDFAPADCTVVPAFRGRGIGSELLAGLARHAAGRPFLKGSVYESDLPSRAWAERRGYEVVGGEKAVTLELAEYREAPIVLPDGVEIVALAERPDLAESLYEVGEEAAADIPGEEAGLSFEQWRALELDRPSKRRDLFVVALAQGEPIGYANVDEFGKEGRNGLTGVVRAWRRRGVAEALKRTQIELARSAGLERLITSTEARNVPMSSLNAKLGYRPDPVRSTLTVRGPVR